MPSYTESSIRAINNSNKEIQLHDYHERGTNRKIPYLYLPSYTSADKTQVSSECLVYFHGNAEDIGHSVSILHSLRKYLNMNVFAMEYPGYGLISRYSRNPHIMKENAIGFYRMIKEELGFPSKNIIVFGRSIGSGPACFVASNPDVKTLVLMSPIASIKQVATDHTCRCVSCCLENFFDNVDCVRRTNAKLLVIHGNIDEVVPFSNGQTVVDVPAP